MACMTPGEDFFAGDGLKSRRNRVKREQRLDGAPPLLVLRFTFRRLGPFLVAAGNRLGRRAGGGLSSGAGIGASSAGPTGAPFRRGVRFARV
jgi:hypothetical protein